ncbi:MAG: hypothetical protein ACE5JP_11255 [Candidatus Bipolaricaulia bacterium]
MNGEFPKGRTAFLVIHGIGEQNPFETLDSFSRGLWKYLKSQGMDIEGTHQLAERKGAGGVHWTESFVRLSSPQGEDWIDTHEHYWAYLTEEKISVPEVWQWVDRTLQGTKRFYKEESQLQRPRRFPLQRVVRTLRLFYPMIRLTLFLISHSPYLKWLQAIREWIEQLGTPFIVGYIGDIAIYTTMDQKSRHYRVRQQILAESQALLEAILKDEQYDRVIVAGHSLGSVIAYDTLNRLNIKAELPSGVSLPLAKLQGLITFGSPLDKIAFFFREQVGEDQHVRHQIIQHLHSFKVKPLRQDPNPYFLTSPVTPKLDELSWVNYYNNKDPISGRLDFYHKLDNVYLKLPDRWGVAHGGYWDYKGFYDDIAQRFLA